MAKKTVSKKKTKAKAKAKPVARKRAAPKSKPAAKGKAKGGAKKPVSKKKPVAKKKAAAKKKAPAKKKGVAKKKPAAKKPAAKKPAAKKKPVAKKKAAGKKKPAAKKKAAAKQKPAAKKKAPAKKKIVAKAPAGKKPAKKKKVPTRGKNGRPLPPPPGSILGRPQKRIPKKGAKKLTKREIESYRKLLLELRERIVDGIKFLSDDNLRAGKRGGPPVPESDDGTENFDREFALNLMSSEQDVIYEIDEALRRIEQGVYGICEITGNSIERERLKAIPYARLSIVAQTEMERGRTRYRPFGSTMSH